MRIYYPSFQSKKKDPLIDLQLNYIKTLGHKVIQDDVGVSLKKCRSKVEKANLLMVDGNSEGAYVSHLVTLAISLEKPVVAFSTHSKPLSNFYDDLDYEKFLLCECNSQNYKSQIKVVLDDVNEFLEKRFTFILPADLANLMDRHFKATGQSRSELIRNLLRERFSGRSEYVAV